MKKEYLPWIFLYFGFAGLFFVAKNAPASDAEVFKTAITGLTWCRIISFAYLGFIMEMAWYEPRTHILNACRAAAELAILVGLWSIGRQAEVVASVIAIALYELSRQRIKYNF